MTTRVHASIITAWVLWGALVGAGVLVAAYVSAIVFGVVGAVLKDAVNGLGGLLLGLLALPAFAVEGALGGALLGAIVGVAAKTRPLGSMKGRGTLTIRLVGSVIFAVVTFGVVGVYFDVGRSLSGFSQILVRWGWAIIFGLVVGLVCYRTSSKPVKAMTQN